MRGTKRIVDIYIAQFRELRGKCSLLLLHCGLGSFLLIVGPVFAFWRLDLALFLGMKPDILKHQHFTQLKGLSHCLRLSANTVG